LTFLLGYIKQLLPKRPDLKLIITSATLDTERFSAHFDNAPIFEVSGRTYPVEVRYHPPVGKEEEKDRDMVQDILRAVDEINLHDRQADILIFLAGERDIRETAEALRKHRLQNTEILPLYARLSAAEQNRVFAPSHQRRIVLATNVAETSLTVPKIKAVIDPGLARISRYSTRNKVQRLPIEKFRVRVLISERDVVDELRRGYVFVYILLKIMNNALNLRCQKFYAPRSPQ